MEVDERPTVQEDQPRPQIAGEPGDAGEAHQRADKALAAPVPGDGTGGEQHEPDNSVGNEEAEIVAARVGDRFGSSSKTGCARRGRRRHPRPTHRVP
jgi:hypothetical protein